jgi:hypothetical protein
MYKKHKQPSDKQAKFLALLEADPTRRPVDVAREVGYSENTIKNLKANVLNRPVVKSLLDNYRYQLEQNGINPQRLARKLDQLLDAKDPVVTVIGLLKDKEGNQIYREDRKTQLGAMKLLHDVYGVTASKEEGKLKRRLTLEEFEEKEQLVEDKLPE